MKSPSEKMLEGVQWKAADASQIARGPGDGTPYATHEGVLDFKGHKLRCYRLNTGQAIIHADDLREFLATCLGCGSGVTGGAADQEQTHGE